MRIDITDVRIGAVLAALFVPFACAPSRAAVPSAMPAASPGGGMPAGHPDVGTAADAGPSGAVAGTIGLSPALATAAREGRALFLIARAGQDQHIVAVKRVDELKFPQAFDLSPQDAMSHGTGFEGPLEITARLSRSGDAAPAAGDLEGVSSGVAPGTKGLRLEIRTVRR